MGVRFPEEAPALGRSIPVAPLLAPAFGLSLLLFAVLVSNGRPIGAGDTRATERVATSLVEEADLDLDEHPEVEPPFAVTVREHRVSIYPVLSAVLAAPVFGVSRALFALDETGSALAGKLAASLLSSLAAGVLFLAVAARGSWKEAGWTAAVFALGTSVWSTSQALWQHPAAVLFLCVTLLWIVLAEHDPAWAGRTGLPLGLAVASRHADAVLVTLLAVGIALRWPRRLPQMVLWGLPATAFVLAYNWIYFTSPWRHGFSGSLARFSQPWGTGHVGLLISPGKGLLVFTPVLLVAVAGLVLAFRRGERWLAGTLAGAAVGHWLVMGRWSEWHGGESWGPRLLTDALPLLFLFLPEGLELLPRLGGLLAVLSVGIQALGAFAYDYRWERIYQRPPASGHPELWALARSPIGFYARRRVLILAAPALRAGRAVVREHPLVLFGPEGSRIEFRGEDSVIGGAEPTFGDVHLQRGARVEGEKLRLQGRWAGVFLRILPAARSRRLELRIAGRGEGTLYVGERSFWSDEPRWTAYRMSRLFLIRHPYHYPESGGADLTVTVGRGGGEGELTWVALVPPADPVSPLQAPSL